MDRALPQSVNEFDLIARLTPTLATNPSVVVPAGDDCAVLEAGWPDRYLLFKTDAVVEGIHFTADTEPRRVGHKALARCLSDIAAMGGTPWAAVVTLALPDDWKVGWVEECYVGLNTLASRYQVAIVGGETTTNPERLLLNIAALGTVPKDRCVSRAGAKSGDAIFVTGELGGSLEGRHLDFAPRLSEAQWLASHFQIHSMIDLSDGLAGDLRHVLNSSHVGAELFTDSIPISRTAKLRSRSRASSKTPLEAALSDGEDFELLFTLASKDAVPLLDAWKQAFPDLRLGCIGKVTAASGLILRSKQGVQPLNALGYVHFEKS